ncbi:serine/threonine protein phosphatase 1 [Panacagrimonas perspica]|uniref:Serine/threonine protein phosphatase 1 n=1 Tax=Panacagrimonas perspica TaxID=381431 RepID=A0A4R7P411_9GAMM|nr:metallophosphoesterase [Panacagrimonas perspica]TDU28504.1 serine/threonine protein phosphatase 1 [Panacagrimonas perspica]
MAASPSDASSDSGFDPDATVVLRAPRTFLRVGPNPTGRDFVVGDVHGQISMLDRLLRAVGFDPHLDRLFSLGDLIDRGPGSEELVRRFHDEPSHFCIRGNHEELLLASRFNPAYRRVWERNGGDWADELTDERLEELATIIRAMPLVIELDLGDGRQVGLVHAEVPPGVDWDAVRRVRPGPSDQVDDQDSNLESSLLWGRRRINALMQMAQNPEADDLDEADRARTIRAVTPVQGVDLVLVGHTIIPARRPARSGNVLFLDTGAYKVDGRLTLADPRADRYWQCDREGRMRTEPDGMPLPNAVSLREAYLRPSLATA